MHFDMPAIIPGILQRTALDRYVVASIWDMLTRAMMDAYYPDCNVEATSVALKKALQDAVSQYPERLNFVKSIAIYYHRNIFTPLALMADVDTNSTTHNTDHDDSRDF